MAHFASIASKETSVLRSQRPQTRSAAGVYDTLPSVSLLAAYLNPAERRAFVDAMVEVRLATGCRSA